MLEQIFSTVSGGSYSRRLLQSNFPLLKALTFLPLMLVNGLLFSHGLNKRFKGMKEVEYVHVEKFLFMHFNSLFCDNCRLA